MDKHLHIIAHDIPWPANHGGLMDISFKIKALHEAGILIHLHVFYKQKREVPLLHQWCTEVHYYKRSVFQWLKNPFIPYIVASRINKALERRLTQDHYPILFEGTHTSYFLLSKNFIERRIILRLHNIEHIYYKELARFEKKPFKKLYFLIESVLLKKFELKLFSKVPVLTVSKTDAQKIRKGSPNAKVSFMPVFLPWKQIKSETGKGSYCLYHGNLSVSENIQAATWLLENVFAELNIPFVIAGKNPPKSLIELAHKHKHTCLVENPSEFEMDDMIRKAHLHILPSFNQTGVKLKLLHVLFSGRFCLTNKACMEGSGVEKACIEFTDEHHCRSLIKEYYEKSFTEEDIFNRALIIKQTYNEEDSVKELVKWLY